MRAECGLNQGEGGRDEREMSAWRTIERVVNFMVVNLARQWWLVRKDGRASEVELEK